MTGELWKYSEDSAHTRPGTFKNFRKKMFKFIFLVPKATSYFIEILNNSNILIRNFTGSKNLPYRKRVTQKSKEAAKFTFALDHQLLLYSAGPFSFVSVFLIKVGAK